MAKKKKMMMGRGDESMFGFPAKADVKGYPEKRKYTDMSGVYDYGVDGNDMQISEDIGMLDKSRSRSRF